MGKRTALAADSAVMDPPGWSAKEYDMPDLSTTGRNKQTDVKAFEARAFAIAQSQMAAIFQTGFVMWLMVPNQINLFSIIFMTSMGMTPFKNLMNLSLAFAPVTAPGVNLTLSKTAYVALNLVGVAVVCYKLLVMGLLPVTSADWVSLLPVRHASEFSAGAMPLG